MGGCGRRRPGRPAWANTELTTLHGPGSSAMIAGRAEGLCSSILLQWLHPGTSPVAGDQEGVGRRRRGDHPRAVDPAHHRARRRPSHRRRPASCAAGRAERHQAAVGRTARSSRPRRPARSMPPRGSAPADLPDADRSVLVARGDARHGARGRELHDRRTGARLDAGRADARRRPRPPGRRRRRSRARAAAPRGVPRPRSEGPCRTPPRRTHAPRRTGGRRRASPPAPRPRSAARSPRLGSTTARQPSDAVDQPGVGPRRADHPVEAGRAGGRAPRACAARRGCTATPAPAASTIAPSATTSAWRRAAGAAALHAQRRARLGRRAPGGAAAGRSAARARRARRARRAAPDAGSTGSIGGPPRLIPSPGPGRSCRPSCSAGRRAR